MFRAASYFETHPCPKLRTHLLSGKFKPNSKGNSLDKSHKVCILSLESPEFRFLGMVLGPNLHDDNPEGSRTGILPLYT